MGKGPTIYEIAREAGVSASTAARILSGRSRGSATSRSAVLAAAEALGYHLNFAAQSLSKGASTSIGVLTPDVADPFFMEVLRGVERGLFESGYYPLIADGHWQLGENRHALEFLLGHRVAGLILATKTKPQSRVFELLEELPVVLIGRRIEGLAQRCLGIDNVEGAAIATRHLLGLGHRRIAFVSGPPLHWHTSDRIRGYQSALAEVGLEVAPELITAGNYDERSGYLAVDGLLRQGVPFSAVFATNDLMAAGALLALHQHGLGVPEDVSLVGFDDIPLSAYTIPPLTTVRQPAYRMGVDAATGVLDILQGRPFEAPEYRGELIVRDSSAAVGTKPGHKGRASSTPARTGTVRKL
ncbi:MAG TPA: LacI family DNA-binding transcriptional regulator [Trueperaceae bacterium]|nr:LacI family DNA-binding transcriptional regulator [Trueperaceae bacterium]